MEIVISVAAKIAEYTVAPVGRQLGYLFRYSANVDNLKIQMQDLKDAKDGLQHRVDGAKNNCEEIFAEVETWLRSVDEISEEAHAFLNDDEGHAKALCSSCGSVVHLVTRHQRSRKAKKMSIDVLKTWGRRNFERISYYPPPTTSNKVSQEGYENFESRSGIVQNIMEAVRDARRNRIGLYGMGGVGKTMLAKEIASQAEKGKLFNMVVMVTVSQTPNIEKIQQEIAEMLHLNFGEIKTTSKRADLLRQRLKPEERILLILDDIWKQLDLKEIGIHDECRMLLTTRSRDVLRNYMGIADNNIFEIQALDSGEAVRLFMKIIGGINVENANFIPLARQIVGECAGLPVSIATVAHALKCNMELYIWKDALGQLQRSNLTGIDGMQDKVYASIRLSCDFLGSHEKEAKSLLLICALHEEDEEIEVEDLMRYSVGCRLLQGIYTVNEARNRVNSLVDKLKSHCLLLDGKSKSHVKMHDVIRDVCILIAKEDEHRMNNITSATMYEEFVKDEANKASKVISFLDYDDFKKLPRRLECPCLKLLLISFWPLESIPDDFFEQTRKLEALGINYARLQSLPPSFQFLQNLQTLCLRGSSLEDIAVIGELKNLKVLDLSWSSSIELLPKEIGELRRLQLLDLQGCFRLKFIEPNVISNMTQMEELYLPKEFKGWEIEEGSMKERRNASLIEIKSLQLLTVLYLSVASEHILPEKVFSEKLERYQVCIGVKYKYNEFPRGVQLNLSNMNEINASGLKSLIKRSEYLSLERLVDVTNVVHDLDKDGFPRLKHLTLIQLTSLERICHGKLPTASFKELRKVEVRNCGRLKNLFPLSVTKLLHEIRVEECEMMEEIVSHGRENEGDDEASHNIDESFQLRSLFLHSLPKFVHFYFSKLKTTGESSLVDYSKSFFNDTVSLPNLKKLVMKKLDVVLLWPDQPLSSCDLQNLTSLELERCNRIEYLFCFSMTERLINLKNVKVRDCMAMKGILRGRKTGEERRFSENNTLFAKLESLHLSGLLVCKTFCLEDSCIEQVSVGDDEGNIIPRPNHFFNGIIAFPNLKELTVSHCNNIKYLLSSSMARSLVQLKELSVKRCENIEEVIVSDEESGGGGSKAIIFEKLESLKLKYLPNIIKFCGGDCIECPLLSELYIRDCPKLKEFISNSMGTRTSTASEEMGIMVASKQSFFNDKIAFPNLKELAVLHCDNIKYLLSSVMARSLVQLKTLHLLNCKNIEEVIVNDEESGGGGSKAIIFEKLESLQLEYLPNIVKFCGGDGIECPLLSELKIRDCPKLKEFISNSMGTRTCTASEEMGIMVASKQSLFNDKIAFSNLKELNVWNCNNIKYLLSSVMARSLVQLKTLCLFGSKNIEEVIVSDKESGGDGSKAIIFEKLESLQLHNLPNVIKFCDGDCIECPLLSKLEILSCPKVKEFISNSMGTRTCTASEEMGIMVASKQRFFNDKIAFLNLKELIVCNCNNIKYLLSSVMARSLVQLKKLDVYECENIEEVIVSDEESGGGGSKAIIFEKLKSLQLEYLPNIIKFCGGDCIECPLLSELKIYDCPKLKKFISNSMGTRTCTASEEMGIMVASKQSIFNDKVIFPNLKELETDLSGIVNEIFEITSSQSSSLISTFIPNLSKLKVTCTSLDKPIALSDVKLFLHKYHNIHKLGLRGSFVDGQQQQPGDELINNTSLMELSIKSAHELNHLFGDPEYAQPSHTILFQNLESLSVGDCSRLQSFAPSFMSFHKLETLRVEECNELTYLFSSTTAATLVQLKYMSIRNCRRMREVINTDYYNDEKDQIEAETEHQHFVFHTLHRLVIYNLPSLQRFYSGNKVMSFPNLEDLSLGYCPKMRRFSHRVINISASLKTIMVDYKKVEIWERDLNTTTRRLWKETDDDDDQHCQEDA